MSIHNLAAVILAAGKGTRMCSSLPKVLHPLAGRPLCAHVLELTRQLGCEQTVMVVGHQADAVREHCSDEQVVFVTQQQQLGTGHAVQCAAGALRDFNGTVLILCADVPLLRSATIRALLDEHRRSTAVVTVLSAKVPEPHGYGRIVRGDDGGVERIVEEKDASAEEKQIDEINTGIYALEAPQALELLARLDNSNAQQEYYLTDIIALARQACQRVSACVLADSSESMGINDRVQLAAAAAIMRRRINEQHMLAGVTIVDPDATYIDADVTIGVDSVIQPGVHLRGGCTIGNHCIVETGAVIDGGTIGDYSYIKAGSALEQASVGEHCTIGPMAHLRPGTVLCGHNKIGNYVETKKAHIGVNSQASHLTYIGDAELGRDVNIGCGTITCNYDGINKHKTTIGNGVFVGSDTQFVAPVTIGSNSLIAAGSTITKDVPADSLAIARTPQTVIPGWRKKQSGKKS